VPPFDDIKDAVGTVAVAELCMSLGTSSGWVYQFHYSGGGARQGAAGIGRT
jgi:hypothetical protein